MIIGYGHLGSLCTERHYAKSAYRDAQQTGIEWVTETKVVHIEGYAKFPTS